MVALAVAGVAAGAIATSLRPSSRAVTNTPPCAQASIARGPIAGVLRAPGRLAAKTVVRVGSVLPGQVLEVKAQVGQRVTRGQVLARLDDIEQQMAVAAANAQLTTAMVDASRAERELREAVEWEHGSRPLPDELIDDDTLDGPEGDTALEYINASAQVERREVVLALARRLKARRVIRAPMDGVVMSRSIEAGETIPASPPGPPLFVIGSDPSQLQMTAEIDQRYVARVRPGPAALTIPGGARTFPATVSGVLPGAPAATSSTSYQVSLDVPNPNRALVAGMSATVELRMESEGLLVPVTAVQEEADGPQLLVVTAAGTTPAPVQVGVTDGTSVEVQGIGLAEAQTVIASPAVCAAP